MMEFSRVSFDKSLAKTKFYFGVLAVVLIVMLALIAGCAFGFWPEENRQRPFFYLFGVNEPNDDSHWWLLLIIGIVGSLLVTGLLIAAFSSGVERYVERIKEGRTRFSLSGHIVMIGFNHYSPGIIEHCLSEQGREKTWLTILTASKPMAIRAKLRASLAPEIDARVIIYAGDGNADKHVSALCLDRALAVYIMVEGNEWENQYTQSMALLKEVALHAGTRSVEQDNLLPVNVFVNDTESFEIVQRLSLPASYYGTAENGQNIDLYTSNFYENWARLLWSYQGKREGGVYAYDALDFEPMENTGKWVHLVLVGFNSMGRALLREALRVCHYANYDGATGAGRTLITVIDPLAEHLAEQWRARYPNMGQVDDIELQFIPCAVENEDVRASLARWAADERQLLTIAICLTDPDAAMSAMLSLPEEVFFNYERLRLHPAKPSAPNGKQVVDENPSRVRVLVRQTVKRPADDILAANAAMYGRVKFFGSYIDGFDDSLNDDRIAICVNGVYCDCSGDLADGSQGVDKVAGALNGETYKRWRTMWLDRAQTSVSNALATRYQVDHYRMLLAVLSRADNKPSEALLERLADAEHRRWIAERTLWGWRQVRDGEKRVDSLKIHTCIKPFAQLPDEERVKDRNVVALAAELVAFVETL